MHEIFRLTPGYPYFGVGLPGLEPRGGLPIGADVIRETSEFVSQRLYENFFRVGFGRMTPRKNTYLRAMAELGKGPYRTGDIADKLGVKTTSPTPVRANLIKKGMVYSPSHGEMAFTVPLFDALVRRTMPGFEP